MDPSVVKYLTKDKKMENLTKCRLTKNHFSQSYNQHTCVTPHCLYVQNDESVSDNSAVKSHFQYSHFAMNRECNTMEAEKDGSLDSNRDSSGNRNKFKVNQNLSLVNPLNPVGSKQVIYLCLIIVSL